MATLLNKIRFDGKHYSELTDASARSQIEELALKLKPLEEEIMKYPEGNIAIMKPGNHFVSRFPDDLLKRIQALLS
jgi:hypothetical protein